MKKIHTLIELKNSGVKLDDQQLKLVSSLDEVVEKMENFMSADLLQQEQKEGQEDSDSEGE